METTPQQEKFDRAIEGIKQFSFTGKDHQEFLRRFLKKSFTGEFHPEEYHVSGRWDHYYCWDPDPYVDAQHPLALRCDGHVLAIASFQIFRFPLEGRRRSDEFNLTTNADYPTIFQLQGQHFCEDQLAPLRWEKMLVTIIEDWAREAGFEACLGLPAEKNPHFPCNPRAHMRYDVTFNRMGYKMQEGYWKKDLVERTK